MGEHLACGTLRLRLEGGDTNRYKYLAMADAGLTIDQQGYFAAGKERFLPVGAGYWPGSCGTEMWKVWPAEEIQHDLDLMQSLGFNCVRLFLRWQDFEPTAGKYDEAVFAHLTELLGWTASRKLRAMPVVFSPFHCGATLGPPWRGRRNFFSDEFLRQRAVDFAFTVARICAPHQPEMLGLEMGRELCRLPECQSTSPAFIRTWLQSVASAIKGAAPRLLVTCGSTHDLITRDTGLRLGELAGCDFQALSSSTLAAEHPTGFDGLSDPLCQSLAPMYLEMARAYGPVLAHEISVTPSTGTVAQGAYLRAVLPACFNIGANGFLWSLLRDIPTLPPAAMRPGIEATAGLLDHSGVIKPGFEYFTEFAHQLHEMTRPRISAGFVGLYIPRHYYPRDNSQNAANEPSQVARWLATANYHLRQAGQEVHFIRGDRAIIPRLRTLFIASSHLRPDEAAALVPWVTAGGHLVWHGPDPLNWGSAYTQLMGASPVDFLPPKEMILSWAGADWRISVYPRDIRVALEPHGARVLLADETGLPVVLSYGLGKGSVTYALPCIEEDVARTATDRTTRDHCAKWYEAMLRG